MIAVLLLALSQQGEPVTVPQDTLEMLLQRIQVLEQQGAAQQSLIQELRAEIDRLTTGPADAAALATPPPLDFEQALEAALAEVEAEQQAPDTGLSLKPPPSTVRNFLNNLELSLDALVAAGTSTERGDSLRNLQGGAHDPRRRGFTMQQVEMSALGAVDPYLRGEVHYLMELDSETNETIFELEEAFATASLPAGFQLEVGQFLTEFGRTNPQHPHQWPWQDQPVINTRMFGGEAMRGVGVRLGWLLPIPWFSELHFGAQNPDGETMVSFMGDFGGHEEAGADHFAGISGRPVITDTIRSLNDFVYLARWVHSVDLCRELTLLAGVSTVWGPNSSGPDGSTVIYGADVRLKWVPSKQLRGWPFVVWQSEFMGRQYRADSAFVLGDPLDPTDDVSLPHQQLRDHGFYSQVLVGFAGRWAAGFRGEYAWGAGSSLIRLSDDPLRDDRWRLSPLVVLQATEFSRIRWQYNYDRAEHLRSNGAHSVWLGLEFLFGAHPAHTY